MIINNEQTHTLPVSYEIHGILALLLKSDESMCSQLNAEESEKTL